MHKCTSAILHQQRILHDAVVKDALSGRLVEADALARALILGEGGAARGQAGGQVRSRLRVDCLRVRRRGFAVAGRGADGVAFGVFWERDETLREGGSIVRGSDDLA